jgi:integrase
MNQALIRKRWVDGELAAMRVPDLSLLREPDPAPTFAEAAQRWQASRIDAAANTRLQHRTAINRALPVLGHRRLDELGVGDITDLVTTLHEAGRKRETIRKTRDAVAMVLDHAGLRPNVARDPNVRLPREESEEPQPPSAEEVAAVFRLIPSKHRLPMLWLDWSGARVGSVDGLLVGDYDQARRRVRLRKAITKMRRALWVELPPVLAEAIEATLPHPRFRDPEARLFPESGADAMRTAIAKACAKANVPHFSPHDFRHRRISLLHLQGMPWARIGEFVGQRNLAVTANTYTHVLLDEAELDYAELLEAA